MTNAPAFVPAFELAKELRIALTIEKSILSRFRFGRLRALSKLVKFCAAIFDGRC
jgi:hypothetical protein